MENDYPVDLSDDANDDEPRGLLKSVSAPNHRGKGFVRPNCSTTFWLQCPVCCRRYFKYDSHFECFSRWCEICQDVFPSATELGLHAVKYHRKNYCVDCNHVYDNIRGHRAYEHGGSTVVESGRLMGTSEKPAKKIVRAATATSSIK